MSTDDEIQELRLLLAASEEERLRLNRVVDDVSVERERLKAEIGALQTVNAAWDVTAAELVEERERLREAVERLRAKWVADIETYPYDDWGGDVARATMTVGIREIDAALSSPGPGSA